MTHAHASLMEVPKEIRENIYEQSLPMKSPECLVTRKNERKEWISRTLGTLKSVRHNSSLFPAEIKLV